MRYSTLLSLLPLVAASPAAERTEPAPLYLHEGEQAIARRGVDDKFIVKFKSGSPMDMVQQAVDRIGSDDRSHRFDGDFLGFAARIDRPTVELFRWLPDVEYIEQDTVGGTTGFQTQFGSTWGLGRISHQQKGSSDYVYDETAGQGVCVYITDSGVDENHPEFEGRAHQIKSFIAGSNVDDLGHGTHCAGTVGSRSYGVAKKAEIYGVKVINSEDRFWYSDLIAAYDFIRYDSSRRGNCPNGFVVSGSLGGGYSKSLNDAADAMVDSGFFMAVAAGNDNDDTQNYSPGSAPKVCTVGGTQFDDRRYSNSNYGPLVDINGPAVDVLSTLPDNRTAYFTGTSMATPHIAGLAAYLASKNGVRASPSLCKAMVDMSTKNAVTNQKARTVTNVAYNGSGL